ncbi:MAG TPA: putative Ig domain-containing protein [Blastocatellia bacterium]|nr:putative Ig domain-containing protein [Blastocatellia bacterium]
MARLIYLSCAVVLLFLSSTALAQPHSHDAAHYSRSPVAYMNGYTLVLVEADTKEELAEARDFITEQGGQVAIVVPPRAIMGWITPEVGARIIGRRGIHSIHRAALNSIPAGFADRQTRFAIDTFNEIASGRRARRVMSEIKSETTIDADHPPMADCALPRPPISRADIISNLRSMGAVDSLNRFQSSFQPQFMGNSEVMDGTVAVAVFLVESAGGIDPNIYNWSQADQTAAFAQVIDGLNWWVDQSRAFRLSRPLQFTFVFYDAANPVCQVPYEPILHPGLDANLWVERIMSTLGGTSADVFARVGAFNQRIRDENRANWAFSMFIAYNPPPARNSFTDGRASWAYLGGPHANILFRSFGWPLAQLVSHEVGHIFYACDEYSQPGHQTCSCTCTPLIRPQASNGNCEDPSCNRVSIPCMMRLNEFALCQYTVAQIGWTERVLPPAPAAPAELVATATSPNLVNIIWQDTSTVEDGFQIERRGGSDGNFSQIAVVSANTSSYNDATVLPNTAYAYRVRSFNTAGVSSYSSEASVVTPTVSTSLAVATADMPDATVNVSYSRTLIANGGSPGYSWTLDSGSLPAGLSLSSSGTIAGTPPAAGTNNFVVRVTDSNNNTATKALRLVVKPSAPLTITTGELPRGSVGNAYSQNLGASGGQTPYSWTLQSGNLPDGLTLNQSGNITGTPERAGASSFVLRVTDSVGASVTTTLAIIINPAVSLLALETPGLPDGVVGQNYSQQLRATGGNAPYRWELAQGQLPDGLTLTDEGIVQGNPVRHGDFVFTIRVSDQSGQSVSRQMDIEIDPAPELTILGQTLLPAAAVGVPYRVELKATAGTAPYNWFRKGKVKKIGVLPDGITLSSQGVLSGTPNTQATYTFLIRVKDATGKQASKSLTIEVGPPPPPLAIMTEVLPSALQGLPYSARLEAGGGAPPYSWSIESGLLPDGLTMNEAGVITGRASTIGATTFVVRLRDAVGTSSVRQFFISVAPPPPPLVIQTVQLPETAAEQDYTTSLQAAGGVPPYTWSIMSGSLAAGLNLSASGVISGTPTAPGTSVFVVRVTDSAQQTVSRTLAINVRPADKLAPFGALETPDFGTTLNNMASGTGWALDNVGIHKIEVLVDGEKVGEAIYGLSRPDVAVVWGNFPNARNSGFSFTFDTTQLSNGAHKLAVRVLDQAGNASLIGQRSFNTQNRVFTIATRDVPRGRRTEPYSTQLLAADGRPPYTWSIVSGSLPPGLSLSASGLISGTPQVAGNFLFTVRAADTAGGSATASYSLGILNDVEPLRILSTGDLTEGKTGVDYTHQLLFAGGRAPRTWSVATGSLPPGLQVDFEFGTIFGKPTQVGTFTFTMQLRDATPTTVTSETLRITITPGPLVITTSGDLTSGRVGTNYSFTLQKLGGRSPHQWALNSGDLPPGLTLNASTGVISGTPTEDGVFTFTVRLTDAQSPPASVTSGTLRLVIDVAQLAILSSGDLTGGKVGQSYSHQLLFTGGRAPYSWAVAGATLPPGLTLNSETGLISGTPTQTGTYNFTVRLTDSASTAVTSGNLRIAISP